MSDKVKRRCVCSSSIESETDQTSVAHALREHYATSTHQQVVAELERIEADRPHPDVPIRNGWAGVTAGLRRLA